MSAAADFSAWLARGAALAADGRRPAVDLAGLDRPDVAAVDRGHRRDVARAQALEGADVDVGVLAAVLDAARRTARRRRAASTRCSCTRRRRGGRRAACRTCRRRWRPRSGRRASAASRTATCVDRLAASTSRSSACAACSAGMRRRAVVGVAAPSPPRSSRAQLRRAPASWRDRGPPPGSLVRSRPRPSRERASRARSAARVSGRSPLPVDPSEDRVEHRERRDQVGDVGVPDHRRGGLEVDEATGRACARAPACPSRRSARSTPSSPRGPSIG